MSDDNDARPSGEEQHTMKSICDAIETDCNWESDPVTKSDKHEAEWVAKTAGENHLEAHPTHSTRIVEVEQ